MEEWVGKRLAGPVSRTLGMATFIMRIAKRIRLVIWSASLVVAVGLLVLGFDSVQTVVGNGYFDLTVELKSTGPEIVRASGQAFMNKERADEAVEELKDEGKPWLSELVAEPTMYVIADPYDGKPLRLRLYTSGGGSPLRGYSSKQPEYLLVIADLADGQRVFKLASIPDRKQSRVLEVSLP